MVDCPGNSWQRWTAPKVNRRRRQFIPSLIKAALSQCEARVSRLITELLPWLTTSRFEEHRNEFLKSVISVLGEPAFQRMDNAYKLISLLTEEDWEELPVQHRESLILRIEHDYDSFAHWMAPFVMSEFIGTKLGAASAVQLVRRLMPRASRVSRQFLPHVLEHVVMRVDDPSVLAEAVALLEALSKDPAPDVVNEAKMSLSVLVRRGRVTMGAP